MTPVEQTQRDSPPPPLSLAGALAEPKGFDFRHFWHSILERVWIVVFCVLAGLLLALGYLARTPKLYQGHIVLEVEVQEPTMVNDPEISSRIRSAFLASQEAMRTIEQNLTNRTLLARVIRAEGLANDGGRALLGRSATGDKKNAATSPSPAPPSPGTTGSRGKTGLYSVGRRLRRRTFHDGKASYPSRDAIDRSVCHESQPGACAEPR